MAEKIINDEIMESVKKYIEKTGRRITFEYILLKGINDQEKDALELVKLVKGINCYINLIPYNETENIIYKRSFRCMTIIFCFL